MAETKPELKSITKTNSNPNPNPTPHLAKPKAKPKANPQIRTNPRSQNPSQFWTEDMEDEFRVAEYITGIPVYTAKTLVTEMMGRTSS